MKAILGKKILMTRIFDKTGTQVPITLIKLEKNIVSQVKNPQTDGYRAIQVAAGKKKKINAPKKGHLKKIGENIIPEILYEIKTQKDYQIGQILTSEQFEEGEKVNVTGVSKGRGFAGTVKRHNFHLGPKTHGSHNYRQPGSIGATYPERVIKGRRMPGHLGHQKVTVKNLSIIQINQDTKEIMLKGAIPGPKNTTVLIWSNNED